jgi:hypothetical protein
LPQEHQKYFLPASTSIGIGVRCAMTGVSMSLLLLSNLIGVRHQFAV